MLSIVKKNDKLTQVLRQIAKIVEQNRDLIVGSREMVSRQPHKLEIAGSTPASPIYICEICQKKQRNVFKCNECNTLFCDECGDVEMNMCDVCCKCALEYNGEKGW